MILIGPQETRRRQQPEELYVCDWMVAVDTREQAPWSFSGITLGGKLAIVKRQTVTLQTGDYSIVGHESALCVERKSPEDFLSSITAGNARFRREHERMAEITAAGGFACVIVEGCLARMCDELDSPGSGRRIGSETILGIAAAWPQRYRAPWYFAGDRRRAELLAFKVLWKWSESLGAGSGSNGLKIAEDQSTEQQPDGHTNAT